MAEPVGIIASAITVASTAAQLSLALFKVAQTFKHAPEEISEIALEISSLSNSFNTLVDALQTCQHLCTPTLFQELESVLERFRKIEVQLTDLTSDRGHRTLKRLKWFFDAPKAKSLLKKVESVKSALTLMLSIMRVTAEQVQIQHIPTDDPKSEDLTLPQPSRPNRFRKVLETVIEANRLTVDRAQREEEDQPLNFKKRHFNTQLRRYEADSEDTATWLYHLVFMPQPPPKPFVRAKSLEHLNPTVESDNESDDGNASIKAVHGARAHNRSPVPAENQNENGNVVIVWNKNTETSLVADRLLRAWTILDAAQIEGSRAFFKLNLEEQWKDGLMQRIKEYSDLSSHSTSKVHTVNESAATKNSASRDLKDYELSDSESTSSEDEYLSAEESTVAPNSPRVRSFDPKQDDPLGFEFMDSSSDEGEGGKGNVRTRTPPLNRSNVNQRRAPFTAPNRPRGRFAAYNDLPHVPPPHLPPHTTQYNPFYGQPPVYGNTSNTAEFRGFAPASAPYYDSFVPPAHTPFYPPPPPTVYPRPRPSNARKTSGPPKKSPPPSPSTHTSKATDESLLSRLETLFKKIEHQQNTGAESISDQTNAQLESKMDQVLEARINQQLQSSNASEDQGKIDRLEQLVLEFGELQRKRHEDSEAAWKMAKAKSDAIAAENALEERKRAEKEIASAKAAKKAAEKALEFAREQAADRARKETELKVAEQHRIKEEENNKRIQRYEEQLSNFTRKFEKFLEPPQDPKPNLTGMPLRRTAIQEGDRRIEISEYTKEHLEPFISHGSSRTVLEEEFLDVASRSSRYSSRPPVRDNKLLRAPMPPTSREPSYYQTLVSAPPQSQISSSRSIRLPAHLASSSKIAEVRNSLDKIGISLNADSMTNMSRSSGVIEESDGALMRVADLDSAAIQSSIYWEPPSLPVGSELLGTLKSKGWKPLYARGSDWGQTYFLGHDPIHINFFRPEYEPQFKESDKNSSDECVLIAKELVEEYALLEAGFQFSCTEAGAYVLDCRLTTHDIEALIERSFMLRETNFRRQHRQLQWSPAGNAPEPTKQTYASTIVSESTSAASVDEESCESLSDFGDDWQSSSVQTPVTNPRRESQDTDSGFSSMNIEWYSTLNNEIRGSDAPQSASSTRYKGNGPLRLRSTSTTKAHMD